MAECLPIGTKFTTTLQLEYLIFFLISAKLENLTFTEKHGECAVRCRGKIFVYSLFFNILFNLSDIFIPQTSYEYILEILKSPTGKGPRSSTWSCPVTRCVQIQC